MPASSHERLLKAARSIEWPAETRPDLDAYYRLGQTILRYASRDGRVVYGSQTVEQFCKAYADTRPIKESTVHSCIRFAREVTKEDLALLKKTGCSWRRVRKILSYKYAQLSETEKKARWTKIRDHLRRIGIVGLDQLLEDIQHPPHGATESKREGAKECYVAYDTTTRHIVTKIPRSKHQATALAAKKAGRIVAKLVAVS